MFTSAFWCATAERALKSFGQGAASVMAVDWAGWFGFQANLETVLGTGGVMALFSVLTSLASAQIGVHGSPSLAATAEVEAATTHPVP